MEYAWTIVGALLTTGYLVFVISLYIGVRKLNPGKNHNQPPVSIIVAARTEEKYIGALLDALLKQDYPKELLEIIIVNDRSEDGTRAVIDSYRENNPHLRVIDITECPDGFSPKKYALTAGIDAAKGEIICTTDADCIPPPAWVSTMISYFEDGIGMVVGYSPLIVKGGSPFFAQYLYIDSLALAVVAAGGIGCGTGWTCAGRNLAYRKSVFYEVGGYEKVKHQVSGDDDLLMHMILTETNWKLRYAMGGNAAVPSIMQPGMDRYVNQRTRHASKFREYPALVKTAAFTVFLFYCSLGLYPVYMLAAWNFLPVYALMIAAKFMAEYITVRRGSQTLGATFGLSSFLRAFFIHPFLIVLFSIRGARGKFTWKDRAYHQQ